MSESGVRYVVKNRPKSTTTSFDFDSFLEKVPVRIKNTLSRTIGLAGVVIISLSAMLPGIFIMINTHYHHPIHRFLTKKEVHFYV